MPDSRDSNPPRDSPACMGEERYPHQKVGVDFGAQHGLSQDVHVCFLGTCVNRFARASLSEVQLSIRLWRAPANRFATLETQKASV